MNKFLSVVCASLLTLTLPFIAFAQDGYFASFYTGANLSDSKITVKNNANNSFTSVPLKVSPMVGLSYQYSRRSLSFGISYEGRFSKFSQSLNVDDRVISNIGLVTASYTVNHNGLFQPYIGVGAGIGSLKMKISNIHSRTFASFAYQGMAGFKIKVSNKLYIFTDARLTDITRRKYRGGNTSDRAGARYLTAAIGFSYFIGKYNDAYGSASR